MDQIRSNCVTSFSTLPPFVPQSCEGSVPLRLGPIEATAPLGTVLVTVAQLCQGSFARPDLSPLLCQQSLVTHRGDSVFQAWSSCSSRVHCGRGKPASRTPAILWVLWAILNWKHMSLSSAQNRWCFSFWWFSLKAMPVILCPFPEVLIDGNLVSQKLPVE